MKPLPYLLLRLLLGISFFGHGLVRLPKLNMFSGWMVKTFENSMLPQALVLPFSYVLPFAELITGALLLIGLLTWYALIVAACIAIILIFGSCLIEEWGSIPSQLLHGGMAALLLNFTQGNTISVDYKLKQ